VAIAQRVAAAPGSRAHERGAQLPRVAQGGGLQAQSGSRPEPQSAPGAAPCCVRAAAASTARAVDAGARGAGLETSGGCCLRRKWRLE